MKTQQKIHHVASVLALAVSFVCFHILGGGSEVQEEDLTSFGLNMALPEASKSEIESHKLQAVNKMQRQEEMQARKNKMQSDSFDWWVSDDEPSGKQETQEEQSSIASPSPIVGKKSEKTNFKKIKSNNITTSEQVRATNTREQAATIMRAKRRALEKKFGIQLSDEGEADSVVPVSPAQTKVYTPQESNRPQRAPQQNGFYGLDDVRESDSGDIRAVIHGDQTNLGAGSMVKMRLLDPVYVNGIEIPANSFVYGVLSFTENRANIRTENVQVGNRVVPFKASIYDLDGFEGIYIPDNLVGNVKSDAAGQAVSGANLRVSTGSSLVNTTVNALTQAAKSASQAAVRERKVSISSNYSIIMKCP